MIVQLNDEEDMKEFVNILVAQKELKEILEEGDNIDNMA